MRILHIVETPDSWKSGIWYHRIEVPSRGLAKRGHGAKQVAIGQEMPDAFMEYPSTVIMGRIYPEYTKPLELMKAYKKQGTRVVWDIDDDYWAVDPANPSKFVSNVFKDQYEDMIREADVITTPSIILAKKLKKIAKKTPIKILHNAIDYDDYKERPHEHKELIIGYMGAASHWKDLQLIVPALEKLYEKHDFTFVLYGMTGEPLEAAMHSYNRYLTSGARPEQNDYFRNALGFYDQLKSLNFYHIPFYPPEIHPVALSRADFDIGLCPLEDKEFNRGKSNIKFYEYAATGTVTLASDVHPYKQEVTYRAKNTTEDWYNKIEKLIVDKEFRAKLLKEQQAWVKENRDIKKIAIDWELACQKPYEKGAPKVLNQQK
jgi:glycosyltransferase involved in cell wall biosynthesis